MDEANRMDQAHGLPTFEHLQTAPRTIQGRKGSIPEDTPTIEQMTMQPESKKRLLALAHRMDKIMEIEAMGGSVPRGALFYGPPGTGKTLTARALAKTANWAFLSVSGMDLISDPKRIDALVEEASDLRPCVVFIDEADDVFKDRRFSNTATVTNSYWPPWTGLVARCPIFCGLLQPTIRTIWIRQHYAADASPRRSSSACLTLKPSLCSSANGRKSTKAAGAYVLSGWGCSSPRRKLDGKRPRDVNGHQQCHWPLGVGCGSRSCRNARLGAGGFRGSRQPPN